MRNKRLFVALAATLLAVSVSVCLTASAFLSIEIPSNKFQGTRSFVMSIDRSDLNNYINGGQPYFDYLLRAYAPKWLEFSMKSVERDVKISMSFTFSSFDDYKTKVSELITDNASIGYNKNSKGFLLLEANKTHDLMMFVYAPLSLAKVDGNMALYDLFKVENSTITVNGKEYQAGERVHILPEGEDNIPLSMLKVATEAQKDGQFKRILQATASNAEQTENLYNRFKKQGQAKKEEDLVSVTFEAMSLNELNEITSACLYEVCSTVKTETKLEKLRMSVTQTEMFGLESLLVGDDFTYEYLCPSYYKNIRKANEEEADEDGKLEFFGRDEISYSYEQNFCFDSLSVETDLTNIFGKIKKTIILSAPQDAVEGYHETLKEGMADFVGKGVTLNIYNEGSVRHYAFTYSSWRQKDINRFVENILGGRAMFALAESWIPYGKSEITERIDARNVMGIGVPIETVKSVTVLPRASSAEYVQANANGEKNDGVYTLSCGVRSGKLNTLEYHRFNLLIILIDVLILAVICAAVLLTVCRIKKKKAQNKNEA